MERLTEKERAWQEDLYWCDYLNPSAQAIDDVYSRLADIEDILGSKYDIDRMRELIEADREGRCVVLNTGYTETAGGKALKQAMYLCSVTNNEVTRYTADAIAEKLVREERFFEAVKERK